MFSGTSWWANLLIRGHLHQPAAHRARVAGEGGDVIPPAPPITPVFAHSGENTGKEGKLWASPGANSFSSSLIEQKRAAGWGRVRRTHKQRLRVVRLSSRFHPRRPVSSMRFSCLRQWCMKRRLCASLRLTGAQKSCKLFCYSWNVKGLIAHSVSVLIKWAWNIDQRQTLKFGCWSFSDFDSSPPCFQL